MVHQQVVGADRREEVRVLVQAGRHLRSPGRVAQRRPVQRGDFEHAGVVERTLEVVDVLLAERETLDQRRAHRGMGLGAELEPHDRLEAALPQVFLDQFPQAVVPVLLERDVRVAGDAEQDRRLDLHAREQLPGVVAHQVAERNVAALTRLDVGLQWNPLRQAGCHLDPHRLALVGLRVAQQEAPGQREVRQEREWMRGVEAQRRQRG